MDENTFPTPCVSAYFLCTDSLIGALNIIGSMVDAEVEIQFYKAGIIVEVESDNTKAKIEINKSDMFHYIFNRHPKTDAEVDCYCITTNITELCDILKSDKKACVNLYVLMQKKGNEVIIYSSCEDQDYSLSIKGTLSYAPFTDHTDIYASIYGVSEAEPVSIFTDLRLKALFPKFRDKDFQVVKFVYEDEKPLGVVAECHKTISTTLPFPGRNHRTIDVCVNECSSDQYIVSLSQENIGQIIGIQKLGPYNVIKVYCSMDNPLIFRTKISNYGTFELLFTSV